MGNRAVIIVTNGQGWWSPSIYLHWHGDHVKDILKTSRKNIRPGDVSYTAARIIGTAHQMIPGRMSLGVSSNYWQEEAYKHNEDRKNWDDKYWWPGQVDLESVDQGDTGIHIFNCGNGEVRRYFARWNERLQKVNPYEYESYNIDMFGFEDQDTEAAD